MSKIVRVNGAKTDGGQTYIVYIDRGDIQYQKVANMLRKWPTCETIERSHFECSRPSSMNLFHPRKRPSHWSIPILLLCMWHAVEMSVWCWASLDLCVYLVLSRTLSKKLDRNQKLIHIHVFYRYSSCVSFQNLKSADKTELNGLHRLNHWFLHYYHDYYKHLICQQQHDTKKIKKEVFKHKIPATLIFMTYSPVPLLFVA